MAKKHELDLNSHIPTDLRNKLNTGLNRNLFNRFLSRVDSEKVSGWIGPQSTGADVYVDPVNVQQELRYLTPVSHFTDGTEVTVKTYQDLVNRLREVGVNTDKLGEHMSVASFNFYLPVDIDRFINYPRYRWYGHLTGDTAPSYNPTWDPDYITIARTTAPANDWQRDNYWAHEDDLAAIDPSFTKSNTVQATRPIIEYRADLELNGHRDGAGVPVSPSASSAIPYAQVKTSRGDYPRFNMYYVNGEFSSKVSSIVSYVEAATAPVDSLINRRISLDAFGDFSFVHSLVDPTSGIMMHYKQDGILRTCWSNAREVQPRYVKKNFNGEFTVTDPATDFFGEGVWEVPEALVKNPFSEQRTIITFGDLITHFSSVMSAQDGFTGNPFGANNFRSLVVDYSLGGTIKDYNESLAFFWGVHNVRDVSVPRLIEFARERYDAVLNQAKEYVYRTLAATLTDQKILPSSVYGEQNSATRALYESFRAEIGSLDTFFTFQDTTSGVPNTIITLPYVHLLTAIEPAIEYDGPTQEYVIRHHDGHRSAVTSPDLSLARDIVNVKYTRSDGSEVSGIANTLPPTRPYAFQFWLDTGTGELKVFNALTDDGSIPTNMVAGQFVYDRVADVCREFDGAAYNVVPRDSAWTTIRPEVIIDDITIMLEQQLYDGVVGDNFTKLDMTATIIAGGGDAESILRTRYHKFCAALGLPTRTYMYDATNAFTWNYKAVDVPGTTTKKVMWYDVYDTYFGVTVDPAAEPWTLSGFTDKPVSWDNEYAPLSDGSRWNPVMWDNIKADSHPPSIGPSPTGVWTKKLGVNTVTGELLPPYVSSTKAESAEALYTTIPSAPNAYVEYGDNGYVEYSWRNSIWYNYDRAIASYLLDPVTFTNQTWGDVTYARNDYEVIRTAGRKLPPAERLLHGADRGAVDAGNIHVTGSGFLAGESVCSLRVISVNSGGNTFGVYGDGVYDGIAKTGVIYSSSCFNLRVNDYGRALEVGDVITLTRTNTGYDVTVTTTPTRLVNGVSQWLVNYLRYSSVDVAAVATKAAINGHQVKMAYNTGTLIDYDSLDIYTDHFTVGGDDHQLQLVREDGYVSTWMDALRVRLVRQGAFSARGNARVPNGMASDWVFAVETLNRSKTVIEYDIMTLDDERTFAAGGHTDWKEPLTFVREATMPSGTVVTGLQNVINVIFGYVSRLERDGWIVDHIDGDTDGLTWRTELTRMVDGIYAGLEVGAGVILSPFKYKIAYRTTNGHVRSFKAPVGADPLVTPTLYDLSGDIITVGGSDVRFYRTDDGIDIESTNPIAGAHLIVDSYKHYIVFENYAGAGDRRKMIYDPFLGLVINRMHIEMNAKAQRDGKLAFGGYIKVGNTFIGNTEKSISTIDGMYDVNADDVAAVKNARKVIGYNDPAYLRSLGFTNRSRFNFWRGFLRNKGTNLSVDAFVNSNRFLDAQVDEFWAYKIAEYGDARSRLYPEIKLNPTDVANKYVKFQFGTSDDVALGFIALDEQDDSRWVSVDENRVGTPFEALQFAMVDTASVDPITLHGDHPVYSLTGHPDAVRVYTIGAGNVRTNLTGATSIALSDGDFYQVNSEYVVIKDTVGDCYIEHYRPASDKFSPARLINYKTNSTLADVIMWDPARDSHTASGIKSIDYRANVDPALYTYGIDVDGATQELKAWGDAQVGKIWWDTRRLAYLPYFDAKRIPGFDARLSQWGQLAPFGAVNVYEWIKTSTHPRDMKVGGNSGEPALKTLYKRDRITQRRVVAWAESVTGSDHSYAHTASGVPLAFDNLLTSLGATVVRYDTELGYAVQVGDVITDDELSVELVVTVAPTYVMSDFVSGATGPNAVLGPMTLGVDFAPTATTVCGDIIFSSSTTDFTITATHIATGESQTLSVVDIPDAVGALVTYNFTSLGVTVRAVTAVDRSYMTEDDRRLAVIALMGSTASVVTIGQELTAVVKQAASSATATLSDWIIYKRPTDVEITADLTTPYSRYKPFFGDYVTVNTDSLLALDDIKNDTQAKHLGVAVASYKTTWDRWVKVDDYEVEVAYFDDATFATAFNVTGRAMKDVQVYVNGFYTNSGYVVTTVGPNDYLTFTGITYGDVVRVIVKTNLSKAELAFDPDVKDDPTMSVQYRYDYNYVAVTSSDPTLGDSSTSYYYWVKNRLISDVEDRPSVSTITSSLRDYGDAFMAFDIITTVGGALAYDAFALANISPYVRKDDTVKARFTRDLALRDDVGGMDRKNIHTEWVLIKESQKKRIPRELWDKLTETVVGQTVLGAPAPSLKWVSYDAKFGTVNRFGLGDGQVMMERADAAASATAAILSAYSLVISGGLYDLSFLDFLSQDSWFATPTDARKTMHDLWEKGSAEQVNKIFFTVLKDSLSMGYVLREMIKTSMISAHSIRLHQ